MKVDYVVDARGLNCPMPLLKAKQQLNKMEEGECLVLFATDKGSVKDIPAFVALTNHKLIDPDVVALDVVAIDSDSLKDSLTSSEFSLSETESLERDSYVYYIVKGL